jgi:hypothetical protein
MKNDESLTQLISVERFLELFLQDLKVSVDAVTYDSVVGSIERTKDSFIKEI